MGQIIPGIIAKDTTDINGKYLFEGISTGNYVVKIKYSTIPTSMELSTKVINPGEDMINSDFNHLGISKIISIDTSVHELIENLNIDAGLKLKICPEFCIPISFKKL